MCRLDDEEPEGVRRQRQAGASVASGPIYRGCFIKAGREASAPSYLWQRAVGEESAAADDGLYQHDRELKACSLA